MQFSDRLYQLRKQARLTQAELAELVHVSRQTISKWEMGNGVPDVVHMRLLGKVFQVSIDYLLDGEVDTDDENSIVVEGGAGEHKESFWRLGIYKFIFICFVAVSLIIGIVRHSFMSVLILYIMLAGILLIYYVIQLIRCFLLKNEEVL